MGAYEVFVMIFLILILIAVLGGYWVHWNDNNSTDVENFGASRNYMTLERTEGDML